MYIHSRGCSLVATLVHHRSLYISQRGTLLFLFTHPISVVIERVDPQLAFHPMEKFMVILDDSFVVRHGSVSCSGEGAEMLDFTINFDLCTETSFFS